MINCISFTFIKEMIIQINQLFTINYLVFYHTKQYSFGQIRLIRLFDLRNHLQRRAKLDFERIN